MNPLKAALLVSMMGLNGCLVGGAVLFGGAAALVIHEGIVEEDTYGGVIKTTPGRAYSASIEIMDELCPKIELEKAFRKVTGVWRSADLEVTVEDLSGNKVAVNVQARKYMMASKETAIEVFHKILGRIKGV